MLGDVVVELCERIRFGEGGYDATQGLTISTPRPSKSLTLRVTTVISFAIAVPAMSASAIFNLLPSLCTWARIESGELSRLTVNRKDTPAKIAHNLR